MRARFVIICLAVVVAAALLLPIVAAALEPPRPGELAKYRRNGTLAKREAFAKKLGNDKVAPRLVKRLQSRLRAQVLGLAAPRMTPPLAWGGMPTTGTDKILVLCIDFSDYPATTATSTITDKVFGAGDSAQYPYESLHNFYQRSSYSQLDLQGTVLGWYRPAYTRASVTQTGAGRENLIKEALQYYNASIDYSQFDNNHDGKIDYFAVLWTGPDNGWANFWWGYQTSWWYTAAPPLDGVTPDTYSWQWERTWSGGAPSGVFTPRVMIHETGHALGLPDYYDYDDTVGPDGGVGGYDMMDSNTGDHNAFSKWLLDWIAPPVVSWVTRTQTLTPSCTNRTGSALVVMPGLAAGNWNGEFFLVQNRNLTWDSNDRNMPGSGLHIWHVDARLDGFGNDYLSNNSYTAHKLLRLQEADGLEEIEQNKYMNAGDYYSAGKQIGTTGTPNTKKYDGTDTGIVVDTISQLGRDVTFRVVGGYDHTAPTSSCDQMIWSGWYTTPQTLTFTAADTGGSLLRAVQTRDNGGSWVDGSSITLGNGVHTLDYRAVDNADNAETPHSATVHVDTLAPVTTSDPLSGWYARSRPLRFYATDNLSGVASTSWRVDGGAWQTGSAVPGHFWRRKPSGEHTIEFSSRDVAGLYEPIHTVVFKLDHVPPATTDNAPPGTVLDPVTVTLTPTDAHSGVAATWYSLNGLPWAQGTSITLPSIHYLVTDTIAYYSVDAVGNCGPVKTVSVSHFSL
jgi:M6 family metalloprotease-like protein